MFLLLLFTFLNVADIPAVAVPPSAVDVQNVPVCRTYYSTVVIVYVGLFGPCMEFLLLLVSLTLPPPLLLLASLIFSAVHDAFASILLYLEFHTLRGILAVARIPAVSGIFSAVGAPTLYTVGGILSYSKIKHIRLSYYDSFFSNRTFEYQSGELAKLMNYRILIQGINLRNSDPVELQIYAIYGSQTFQFAFYFMTLSPLWIYR
jgi:hypothetical protein